MGRLSIGQRMAVGLAYLLGPCAWAGDMLSSARVEHVRIYGELTLGVYANQDRPLPADSQLVTHIKDRDTGLDGAVYLRTLAGGKKEYVLALAGTENRNSRFGIPIDWWTNIAQGRPNFDPFTGVERQYAKALKIAEEYVRLADQDADTSFVAVGHSLAGGIAQYIAVKLGVRAVAFDAAALGSRTLMDVPAPLREAAGRNILHVILRGDPVSAGTRLVPGAGHLGTAVVVRPAPGLKGVVPTDASTRGLPRASTMVQDALARHDMGNLLNSLREQTDYELVRVNDAFRKEAPVWWASPSTVPQGARLNQQIDAIASMAQHAKRVAVVGKGPEAKRLTHLFRQRLGARNVMRIAEETSTAGARKQSADFDPDLIVGVREYAFDPPSRLERHIVRTETALRFAELLRTSAVAAQAFQVHANTRLMESDPVLRARKDRLDAILGNALIGPDPQGRLDLWKKVAKGIDWGITAGRDVKLLSDGKWTLMDSHVVQKVIDTLIDKGLDHYRSRLMMPIAKQWVGRRTLQAAFGAGDLAKAVITHAKSRSLTVDVVDQYCQAAVGATWGALGMVISGGNVKVGQAFHDLGLALGKVGQAALREPIRHAYASLATDMNQALTDWHAQQIINANHGNRLRTFRDWLKERGVEHPLISKAMSRVADEALYTARRLQEAKHPDRVLPSTPGGATAVAPRPDRPSPSDDLHRTVRRTRVSYTVRFHGAREQRAIEEALAREQQHTQRLIDKFLSDTQTRTEALKSLTVTPRNLEAIKASDRNRVEAEVRAPRVEPAPKPDRDLGGVDMRVNITDSQRIRDETIGKSSSEARKARPKPKSLIWVKP